MKIRIDFFVSLHYPKSSDVVVVHNNNSSPDNHLRDN
jgi:hypothetical protein